MNKPRKARPSSKTILTWMIALATIILGIYLLYLWLPSYKIYGYRTLIGLPFIIAFSCAIARVVAYHPYASKKYRDWLAYTPWTYGKPLPLGTFHISVGDLTGVAILAGIAAFGFWLSGDTYAIQSEPIHLWEVAAAVGLLWLITYLVSLFFMMGDDKKMTAGILALVPLTVYPHFNIWIGLSVVGVIYLLILAGIRRTLGGFPWNRGDWTESPQQRQLKEVLKSGIIGWPYRQIGPVPFKKKTPSLVAILLASTIPAWWLFASIHSIELYMQWSMGESYDQLLEFMNQDQMRIENLLRAYRILALIATVFVALQKVVIYISGTRPPISLLGRFATGRLIIPGYDKIFIMPILIIAVGWCLTDLLLAIKPMPLAVSPSIILYVLTVLFMSPYPSIEKWRYTGHLRVDGYRKSGGDTASKPRQKSNQITIELPGAGN